MTLPRLSCARVPLRGISSSSVLPAACLLAVAMQMALARSAFSQSAAPAALPASAAVPPSTPTPTPAGPGAPPLLGAMGGRVAAADVGVVGGNVASARERALAEAMKQAVDQAIASMVPDPHLSQPKTVVQVLGRARGYVRRYRTLEEGERGRGLYGIRIEADIDEGALLRAFDKAPAPAAPGASSTPAAPSYLLVGAGAPDALDAAARAFTTAGARVQMAGAAEATDPSRAVDAASRAGIGTVAFVSGSATSEGKVRGPGVEAVSCTLAVRVLTAGAGLPVADESETVRAFADRQESARISCFQRAAAAVVPRVVPAASARVTPDMRTIVIDAEVVQPAAIPALVKQIRALGSVSAIEVRRISASRVELWVRSRLAAAAFAATLSRDSGGAVVFSGGAVTGDLVRIKGTLREIVVPVPAPSPSGSSSAVPSPTGGGAANPTATPAVPPAQP